MYSSGRTVSIHAPVRGATVPAVIENETVEGFNPRTREGCDLPDGQIRTGRGSFNPRTREGCDIISKSIIIDFLCFNPRTREGCDALTQ